jgi:diketogulonate reductase-like aldo/keto reductase
VKRRKLGASGVEVPIVGQGTWELEGAPRADAIAALRRGLDLGMSHIDTAEMYGSGAVEELVGEAIAGRREEVFLASKVLPQNASRAGTTRACERSLERLKTDRLDLYLLHWPGSHPLEETFAAFEALVEAGKIRLWGVSNFDVDELERALAIAGRGRIACNQVLYHLGARYVEGVLHQRCAQAEVALVGYSPFGSGRFPGERSSGGRVLEEIARAHRATPRQVALAFLLRLPHTFAIPKAARFEHVGENAGGAALVLDEDEVERLARAFPLRGDSLPYL